MWHVARMGDIRRIYKTSVGKPVGRRTLRRPRSRLENNITVILGKSGWDGVDWVQMAQDKDKRRTFVNTVTNLQIPERLRIS